MGKQQERTVQTWQLVEAKTGRILIAHLTRADTLFARLFGLMGRKHLAPDSGLWLPNTNSIHTFGMRISIDVLVLDKDFKILRLSPALPPFRFLLPTPGGKHTLELMAGSLVNKGLRIGDQLRMEPAKG